MKTKLLFLLTLCFSNISISQTTYVPDNNFEQWLINAGYDDALDDYVLTVNINTVTDLDIGSSANVTDLTGIEDFTALTTLTCSFNNIYTLDLSQNINLTALLCSNNLINGTLDLSQNTALTSIICNNNVIDQIILPQTDTLTILWFYHNELTTIDVTQNPNLGYFYGDNNLIDGTLDLSQNTALTRIRCEYNSIDQLLLPQTNTLVELWCRYNEIPLLSLDDYTFLKELYCSGNQITAINFAFNSALETLHIDGNMLTSLDLSNNSLLTYLQASSAGPNLNYLSLKNGNNSNFFSDPIFYGNPSLTCIEVDNAVFSTNNWTATDTQHYFSEDCSNLSVDEFNIAAVSLFPNPVQDKLFLSFKTFENTTYQLINLNGQIILKGKLNQQHESINLSNISPGVYFLKLQSASRTAIKKIIKQ